MKSAPQHEPITFRGGPYGLTAVLPGKLEAGAAHTCSLGVVGDTAALTAVAYPDIDPRILRLTLPPRTPSGSYAGYVQFADAQRPAKFEIDAIPSLRLFPERCHFCAAPGAVVKAAWTILNHGNSTVELPPVLAFGIFMQGGLERALRHAYTQPAKDGQSRLDVLADRLAESHGGLVKVKLTSGAGPLAPGELRPLEAELHLENKLARGASYTGNLELPGLVYPITFEIRAEEGPS
jgi:hypothetical protein